MIITRALSIRQPFVELTLQGKKKFEYRAMATNIQERLDIETNLQPGGLPEDQSVGTIEIVVGNR